MGADRRHRAPSRTAPHRVEPRETRHRGQLVHELLLEPRATRPSTSRTACAANRSTWVVSGRRGSSQYQPQLANIASRDAWACIRVSSRPPGLCVGRTACPAQLVGDPVLGSDEAARDVDVSVARRPGVEAQGRQARLGHRVDAAGQPVERLAQGSLPASVGHAPAFAGPARDAVVAGPARPVGDARLGQDGRVQAAEPDARCHDPDLVRRPRPSVSRRCRNRSRNGWWWPYSSPSVAMTAAPPSSSRSATGPAAKWSASEVAAASKLTVADRPGVVEADHDAQPVPQLHPVGDPRVGAVVGLPGRQERPADALLGAGPERQSVDRGLRQPETGRSVAGPQLDIADGPADLRSVDRGRRRAAGSRGDSPGP